MPIMTFSPKDHILICGGALVEGWKSCQISFPTDEATLQTNADGSSTFIENVGASQFEATITVDSSQNGCLSLQTIVSAKLLAPMVFTNIKGLKQFSCLKARFSLKSFGADDGGSDTNTEFKAIGTADIRIPGGNVV